MLSTSQLSRGVDLPVWEWLRFAPVAPTAGLSCSCVADNTNYNTITGRFIYYLANSTNFFKYDTVTDTYLQLASPPNAPLTATSMRFAGAQGYYGRVISGGSNTLQTGLPFGSLATGYKIRILSGTGAGQERMITSCSDPIVADFGALTGASQASGVTTLTDTAKNWGTGYVGSVWNVNSWIGYTVRLLFGTGSQQVRKVLYNSGSVLTISDVNFQSIDPYANTPLSVTPAANTVYQIESCSITVDTAWDVIPDSTSKYVIQSGGIWMLSGAAAAPFYTMQYYDALSDTWYCKPATTNLIAAAPSDNSLEKITENSTIWVQSTALGSHSTTTIQDTKQNWTINQWVGYEFYIWSGTGRGQLAQIISNTANTLTFAAQATSPDNTSMYQILAFDGGTLTASAGLVISDSSKSWTTNRWSNYSVRIVFGTGRGQLRPIAANTSNTITVSRGWSVQPDTTSKYVIQGNSDLMYLTWGGSSQIYLHYINDFDTLLHSRPSDQGIASVACAMLSNSTHTIMEQPPFALASISGTTTITATLAAGLNHNLKVGQYISARGLTSAAADQYNVTGLVQITTVPNTTSFTYTPFAAGSGTYAYLTALSTTNISDASKDFRDNATGGSTTSITFSRLTPSDINGWYVTGTNIAAGTTISSGAGTSTVVLSTAASATPTGVIVFTKWSPQVSGTFSSGGALGAATVVLSATTPSNINGWYVTGTGVGLGAKISSGAGTATLTFTVVNTAQISGTLLISDPRVAGKFMIANIGSTQALTVPTVTTGLQTGQTMNTAASTGNSFGFTLALANAPLAGHSKYVLCSTNLIGSSLDQSTTNYDSSIATGGSTTTLVDVNAFWSSASGNSGTINTSVITLGSACPSNTTGWYVTGTGVGLGAKILSGAGTTSITVDVGNSAAVSGVVTLSAWNTSLIGRKVKVLSGVTGLNQELTITAVTPTTGTITFGVSVAPLSGATYSLLSVPTKGAGHEINWVFGNTNLNTKGKYLVVARGGATVGIDKIDLTTDRVIVGYTIPNTETLGSGSMYAYDGQDRMYFTKDVTQRCYYIDINTFNIYGAGVTPYVAGTAGIGNKMEIFTTQDGIKYLWINRQQQVECFRQMLFY